MLKKSSSILQELGLDKQVRTELRAAQKAQQSSLQEAPRPLGRPLTVVSSDNVPTTANQCEASADTSDRSTPPVPVERKKVEPEITPPAISRSLEVARQQSSTADAKAETSTAVPTPVVRQQTDVVEAGLRHRAQEAASLVRTSAPKVSHLELRRPPALGAPELRPSGQTTTPSKVIAAHSVSSAQTLDMPPPKPSGSSMPVVRRAVLPPELAGLRWPTCFLEEPRGGRVELTEGAARATRDSGVGRGVCFLGPLQPDATGGSVYFEIEVLELEAQRSQTMALGFATSLPAAKPLLTERATDLGHGCFLVGYDLPKLFVHGETAAKMSARDWRPLKEICCGDTVGLLAARSSAGGVELTVYVNGTKKASVPLPGVEESAMSENALPWPGVDVGSELWGVVDVHGAVRSVRLRRPPAGPLPSPRAALPQRSAAAQIATPSRPLSTNSPPPTQGCSLESRVPSRGTLRALDRSSCPEAEAPPRKRSRIATFPGCSCTAHLRRSDTGVVHISSSDFCIGRDTKVVNLALESADAPNMVSRTHARIVSNDAGVQVIDCSSLNGTWLNATRVANHLLRSGDILVIGNPTQGPPEFRFTVELPSN